MAVSAFQKVVNRLFQQFIKLNGREPQTPKEWMDIQNEAVRYFNKTKGALTKPKAPPFQGFKPKVIQGGKGIESLLKSGDVKKGLAPKTTKETLKAKKDKHLLFRDAEEDIARIKRENKQAIKDFKQKEYERRVKAEEDKAAADEDYIPDIIDPEEFAGGGRIGMAGGGALKKFIEQLFIKASNDIRLGKGKWKGLDPKQIAVQHDNLTKKVVEFQKTGNTEGLEVYFEVNPHEAFAKVSQQVKNPLQHSFSLSREKLMTQFPHISEGEIDRIMRLPVEEQKQVLTKLMGDLTEIRGGQGIKGMDERTALKIKYPGLTDDLLEKILIDDNPQRKAEVLATMDEFLKLKEVGKGDEEAFDIITKSFKKTPTKHAEGGIIRAGFPFGGKALKAIRDAWRANKTWGVGGPPFRPEKTSFNVREMTKRNLGTEFSLKELKELSRSSARPINAPKFEEFNKEFKNIKASILKEKLEESKRHAEAMISSAKHTIKNANQEFNKAFGPLRDKKKQQDMTKRITDQFTRAGRKQLEEANEGLKAIDIYMGMLQKKGRSVHQSGGLAYMLGEPTYMKYGAGGDVGHAPWLKPSGQPQPQGQDQSPTPQLGGAQTPGSGQPNPMKAPRGLPSVAPRTMDPQYMQQQMMQRMMMGQQGQQPRPGMKEGGGFKILPKIDITTSGSTPAPGIDVDTRDITYGGSGLYQGDKWYGGGDYQTGNVNVNVQEGGNTVFEDTMSKDDLYRLYVGLGEKEGNRVEIGKDNQGNYTFNIVKSFNQGGRVPMMYGGDPGFQFEYGGSWADWHDQHRNQMPIEDYIQTKLPKERLPFRAPMAGGGMTRRMFMKLMAGIASLPFIGKGVSKVAPKAIPKVAETVVARGADGMPSYVLDLIEVVKAKGTKNIIEGFKKSDYSTVHTYKGVDVIEDPVGNIKIKKQHEGGGHYTTDEGIDESFDGITHEVEMEIRKGDYVKNKQGKMIKTGDEYAEYTAKPDMDGKLKDVDEYIDKRDHLDLKEIADEIDTIDQHMWSGVKSDAKKASGGRVPLGGGGIIKILKKALKKFKNVHDVSNAKIENYIMDQGYKLGKYYQKNPGKGLSHSTAGGTGVLISRHLDRQKRGKKALGGVAQLLGE